MRQTLTEDFHCETLYGPNLSWLDLTMIKIIIKCLNTWHDKKKFYMIQSDKLLIVGK